MLFWAYVHIHFLREFQSLKVGICIRNSQIDWFGRFDIFSLRKGVKTKKMFLLLLWVCGLWAIRSLFLPGQI